MSEPTPSPHPPSPHEGGGDRLMLGIALVVATGLGGALLAFLLRQYAPAEVPPTPSWHVPPSQKVPATPPGAVPPAPTSPSR